MYYFSTLALTLNELEEEVAPTDSRRRPDQRLMEDGHWDEANAEKQRLEEKQRSSRREREREAVKSPSSPEEGKINSVCFVLIRLTAAYVSVRLSFILQLSQCNQTMIHPRKASTLTVLLCGLHFEGVSCFHLCFTVIFFLAHAGETPDKSKYHFSALSYSLGALCSIFLEQQRELNQVMSLLSLWV